MIRQAEFLCSFPGCNAYRVKASPSGFCIFHQSQFEKDLVQRKPNPTIVECFEDPRYFGKVFGENQESWVNWKVVLKSIFCLEMNPAEVEIYKELTHREKLPKKQPREVFLIMGRRSGKSILVSAIALWMCFFAGDHRKYLSRGERGFVTIISADRSQCQTIMNYIRGFLQEPFFKSLVIKELREQIDFSNQTSIIIKSSNKSSPRSITNICTIGDEVSHWRGDDSRNPDKEIYVALVPTTLTIKNSLMLFITTPWGRSGLAWEKYLEAFGQEDEDCLIFQAPTLTMNPTVSSKIIEKELLKDPDGARAEYLAIFRQDISSWLSYQTVDNAIIRGRGNLPYNPNLKYFSFVDGSSGSGTDSFTCCVGHLQNEVAMIDYVQEWQPIFNPSEVIAEIARILNSYHLRETTGDKFSPGLLASEFARNGITYKYSELSASELYREASYSFNEGSVELPDVKRLEGQLKSLEKRSRTGGRESIGAPPFKGYNDDIANSVSGVIYYLKNNRIPTREELEKNLPSRMADLRRNLPPEMLAFQRACEEIKKRDAEFSDPDQSRIVKE